MPARSLSGTRKRVLLCVLGIGVVVCVGFAFWNRGPYITDTINGYRAVRRDRLLQLGCDADGFVIEYQMSIRAMKRGLKVAEIPTREGPRLGGQSTAHSFSTGLVFLQQLWRELRGR